MSGAIPKYAVKSSLNISILKQFLNIQRDVIFFFFVVLIVKCIFVDCRLNSKENTVECLHESSNNIPLVRGVRSSDG